MSLSLWYIDHRQFFIVPFACATFYMSAYSMSLFFWYIDHRQFLNVLFLVVHSQYLAHRIVNRKRFAILSI